MLVLGSTLGEGTEKIVNDFEWVKYNPFAINKAWDQLYIYLRQKTY